MNIHPLAFWPTDKKPRGTHTRGRIPEDTLSTIVDAYLASTSLVGAAKQAHDLYQHAPALLDGSVTPTLASVNTLLQKGAKVIRGVKSAVKTVSKANAKGSSRSFPTIMPRKTRKRRRTRRSGRNPKRRRRRAKPGKRRFSTRRNFTSTTRAVQIPRSIVDRITTVFNLAHDYLLPQNPGTNDGTAFFLNFRNNDPVQHFQQIDRFDPSDDTVKTAGFPTSTRQPAAWDIWCNFFKKYRVNYVVYDIEFENQSASIPIEVRIMQSVSASGPTFNWRQLAEGLEPSRYMKRFRMAKKGERGSSRRIRLKVNPWTALKNLSRTKYFQDDGTGGTMSTGAGNGTGPVAAGDDTNRTSYLNMEVTTTDDQTNAGQIIAARVRIISRFVIHMWDRNTIAAS